MEVYKGSDGALIIGPLKTYICDGISIRHAGNNFRLDGKPYYHVKVYESYSGSFMPEESKRYKDIGERSDPGQFVGIYMTDEELEALFLAWQMLKKGDK